MVHKAWPLPHKTLFSLLCSLTPASVWISVWSPLGTDPLYYDSGKEALRGQSTQSKDSPLRGLLALTSSQLTIPPAQCLPHLFSSAISLDCATPISLGFKLFLTSNIYFIVSKFLCLPCSAKVPFRIKVFIYVGPWVELLMLTCLSKKY